MTRRVTTSSSRAVMWRLTEGSDSLSARAAPDRLPVSTALTKSARLSVRFIALSFVLAPFLVKAPRYANILKESISLLWLPAPGQLALPTTHGRSLAATSRNRKEAAMRFGLLAVRKRAADRGGPGPGQEF